MTGTPSSLVAILRWRPVWFSLTFLAVLAGYQTWLVISGDAKLAKAGLDNTKVRQHVEVVLSIAPEQFHMTRLQTEGRLIRFEENSAFIMDLPPSAIQDLSRNYWVSEIRPWAGI